MADEKDKSLLPLEELCGCCDGKRGDDQDGTRWRRCGVCNGSGYEPTEFGEAVLSLMRHNLEPMLQDIGR